MRTGGAEYEYEYVYEYEDVEDASKKVLAPAPVSRDHQPPGKGTVPRHSKRVK